MAVGFRSNGATVVWQTPTLIAADGDVSTNGTLLCAYTLGNAGVLSTTVNGVPFGAFAAPDNVTSDVTVGSVTLGLQSGDQFSSDNTAAGSIASPFASLTAAYGGLLQSAVSTNNGQLLTLTLGGLTNGNSYRVQIWSNESSSFFNPVTFNAKTILTAGNSAALDSNNTDATGGVGEWVTGSFTATGATQVITITTDAPSHHYVLNGLQVRTVPEPTSAMLIILSGVYLLLRRQRLLRGVRHCGSPSRQGCGL
jgi:hypothetical protein